MNDDAADRQCFDTVGWTWGADTMSIKQKTGFPVV